MDVMEAIKRRRSIRSFKPEKIPEDVLGKLLEALRLAPTGGNQQPFKFIIVREQGVKEKLATACRLKPGRPKGREFVAEAPAVIVACGLEKDGITRYYRDGETFLTAGITPDEIDKDPIEYLNLMPVDLAIALDHLTLVATEERLGTCWIAALDEREVKKVLSVPDDIRVLFVMPVGYTESCPEPRPPKNHRN